MKKSNNQILTDLMAKHKLTRKRVSELLDVNISTVDRWMSPSTSKSKRGRVGKNTTYRGMSSMALQLLKLKLGSSS